MKIIHICLCGMVTDGFSYQDNLLPKYHKKLGFDVTIITTCWVYNEGEIIPTVKSHYYNEDEVFLIRLSSGKKKAGKFKHYKELKRSITEEKPDILFIHGCQFVDMNKVVRYVKDNPKVMVYVDNHADFFNSGTNFLSKNILHKIIWKHSAQIISPYTCKFYGVLPARVDWLENIYDIPTKKCELLVMGADDDKVYEAYEGDWRHKVRFKYGIEEEDFLVMTGGKIDGWKTQTLLLMEAVHKIENINVRLIVFGAVVPELKDKVNVYSDGKKVQYIGWINSEKLYHYFAAADLMVFPGGHSVLWEQVAGMGIPMLCKYWEGMSHVDLGGNVRFLKEDSVELIYDEIMKIVNDKEGYRKMKRVAKANGMKVFSYKQIAMRSIQK